MPARLFNRPPWPRIPRWRAWALPLAGGTAAPGLGTLPRGSVSAVDGEWLRFFVYCHQNKRRTDYDLSALMLDEAYANAEHVSRTNLG